MRWISGVLAPSLLVLGLLAPVARSQEDEATGPAILSTGTAVVVTDGRQWQLPASESAAGPLFALAPLVGPLGAALEVGPLGQSHTLRLHDQTAIFGPASPVMTVGREIVHLSQPPTVGEGGIQVPLDLLQRTLGDVLGYDIRWDPVQRVLRLTPRTARTLRVDWDLVHLQGMSTLVMKFAGRPHYRIDKTPDGLEVVLLGDRLEPPPRPSPLQDPLVRGLSVAGDRVRVRLAEGAEVDSYERQQPFRIVFDIYRPERSPVTATTPPSPGHATPGLRTIVVDPGHGGEETGAVGPSETEEKQLTLVLAQTLKRRLEARLPVRVVLTRSEDVSLPLDTRTSIANQNKADLFISLHLNSSVGTEAHGAETYFLSLEASDARAAESAEIENRSAQEEGETGEGTDADALSDLQLILWDLAQSRYLSESQRFARLVQEELNQALGLPDRGVKQAPFRVLMGATMPAVLVELGFISNPEEEAKLLRPSYRQELVDSLVRAVTRYRARLGDRPAAGAGPP